MLQWMGGSRKKVATSRKSIYQRQKQYFEQRRRQQQQTTGLEGYNDGKQSCNRNYESSRSLDIMSLPNIVPNSVRNNMSPLLNARDDSEDEDDNDYDALDYRNSCSPVLHANENIPLDECQEEQHPSSFHIDNDPSKNVSGSLRDPSGTLAGRKKKHDNLKLSNVQEISIFDLLDDDDRPNEADRIPVNAQESHVAFSVEGLGKVEPETPVHSPKLPGRCNPNGTSKKQARRNVFPCKLSDSGLLDLSSTEDVKMQEFDLSCRDNFLGQSFRSCDIIGDPNHIINPINSSPYNWDCNGFQGAFGRDEQSYGIRGSDIWNGPSFFEDKTDDVRGYEYESFNKNWMDQRDFGCDDYFNSKDDWFEDMSFGSWNLQNKRSRGSSTMKGRAFDFKGAVFDEPFPHTRHRVADELPDFEFRHTRGYLTFADNGVLDVNPFEDDARETLSLPSEESSTSPAGQCHEEINLRQDEIVSQTRTDTDVKSCDARWRLG